jgi:hypothetical protein
MAVAEIEATLSKLATEIPRDFAAYDDAKQLWKTASAEFQERATAMVEKLRTVLETRADELEECARLAPQMLKSDLYDAATRLRDLDRDVPRVLTDTLEQLAHGTHRE